VCLPGTQLGWQAGGKGFDPNFTSTQSLTGPTATYLSEDNRIWLEDVNGDGRADLVTRDSGNNLNVWLSNGTGYSSIVSSLPASHPGATAIGENNRILFADVNGDGKTDLAIRDSGNNLNIWLSNSTGYSSVASSVWLTYSTATYLSENNRIWFADVNGDGRADLLVRDSGNNLNVWLSNGTGYSSIVSSLPLTYTTATYLSENNRIWFTDVNGDGKADLLLRDSGNGLNIKLSEGVGFTGQTSYLLLTGPTATYLSENNRIWFADVNGDGHADLLVRDSGNNINVHLSDGLGFNGAHTYQLLTTGNYLSENSRLWFADVNGDSGADLLMRDSE